ncbi:MAG: aldo/keto reductase [Mycobacteriales bacterium]
MEYVRLGTSGLKVSRIGLGMMSFGSREWRPWTLDEGEASPIVKRAVDKGINFFDTADVYSMGISEELTGRLLRKFFPRRDSYVLATKVNSPMGQGPNDRGLSRKHILEAVDASLKRLGTDYIDLYQCHRWDSETPIEETLGTLDDLVRSGKVRYLGASSMFAWQFSKALYTARLRGWTRFISMQSHYNLVYREEEREMIPLCRDEGIGIVPWSPLARGLLTGTRSIEGRSTIRAKSDGFARELYDESDLGVVDTVIALASKRHLSPAQISLAWLLHKPGITAPIVGATKPEHVDDVVTAPQVSLTEAEIQYLEQSYRPHAVRGHN